VIPLQTTTVDVLRRSTGADPYEEAGPVTVADNVRAHIGSPSGTDLAIGGDAMTITDRMDCDPCDLRPGDLVTDRENVDGSGAAITYEIVWVRARNGLGLDHMVAGLRQSVGASNG
jgi:hypothetical protein